ncbi:carbohydrate kinase, partial [Pseudomonas sp. BGM005]|nr:carbohydrate kinase [Pseudomonas sp. BG5]
DWIGSTTTVNGEPELGLTTLPDGRVLRDAVEQDPVAWLGDAHVARWGADTRLLVKLLDAGQRLPVHAHPHDDFAAAHLGRAHGKAEAWYILQGGTVHVGLREDVDASVLADLVTR